MVPLPAPCAAVAVGLYPSVKTGPVALVPERQFGTEIFVPVATPVAAVCRQVGVNEVSFDLWKKWSAHLSVGELPYVRQLEEEDARL